MSTPSSSRRRGRPSRSSANSTPSRGTAQPQVVISSPAPSRQTQNNPDQTTTPRNRRVADNGIPSSSPIFFQSSPAGAGPAANAAPDRSSPMPSSPLGDRDTTPRPTRPLVEGLSCRLCKMLYSCTNFYIDSSPIRYMSSSSPGRPGNSQARRNDIPTSSSGLFIRSSNPNGITTRRGDIHSDTFSTTGSGRRTLFVDESGLPVRNREPLSDATFSNLNPDTSEAEILGGNSTRVIWGTNIAVSDTMSSFRNFLYNFARKHRMIYDGATEAEIRELGSSADEKEYIRMLNEMRQLGVTGLNLDLRNLKAFPPTTKLWHQVQSYPQEIIPMMDQCIKDVMVGLAGEEIERARQRNQRRPAAAARDASSIPAFPSSDADGNGNTPAQQDLSSILADIESRTYKVFPFGLDKSINMRDLDPGGMFQLFPSRCYSYI